MAQRSLYEVLGVDRWATRGEIHRAYLRLARQLHPDRLLDRPLAERQAAERRFQEVNQAWSVLRDERSRRDYDLGIGLAGRHNPHAARPHAATERRPAGSPPPPRPRPRPVEEDDDDLVDAVPPGGCMGGFVLTAFIALLVGIGIVTAFARRGTDDPRPVVPVESTGAAVGTCVRFDPALPSASGLAAVDCGERHDAVITATVRFPAPCPDERHLPRDLAGTQIRLCLDPAG